MAYHVTDNERALIGSVLLRPDRMAEAVSEHVVAGWFANDGWSLMWSALECFWQRGEIESATPANVVAEAKRLASRPKEKRVAEGLTVEAVVAAIDEAGAGPLDATIRVLRNAATERAVKGAVAATLKDFGGEVNAAEVVSSLRSRLDEILEGNFAAKKIAPGAIFADILAEYAEANRMRVAEDGPRDLKWTPGIKMPWPKMTQFLNGLRPGLHVVAARPSVGKTSYAVNLMRFWCEHSLPVLFCSLDMPECEVLRRFIAEKARVSARKASFSPTTADLAAMEKARSAASEWPLTVVEEKDVDRLRTICMIEKSAGRLGVLVVDYLQLLHARALGREDAVEYARISYVSDSLKRLANELRVPVIALAQLNRESTKQDAAGRLPGLADLRGSGSIEQDAFTVTILHRDQGVAEKWKSGIDCENAKRLIPGTLENPNYRYNFDDLDPVWWILCKAQNGPTGKLPFLVRKKYFTWMLADYDAKPNIKTTGYGATERKVADNSPCFERVHGDWRHDPLEETLRRQLALLPGDAESVPDVVDG